MNPRTNPRPTWVIAGAREQQEETFDLRQVPNWWAFLPCSEINRNWLLAEVVSAPPPRLAEVAGLGEEAITDLKIVQAAANELLRGGLRQKPVLSSWSAVLDYCRTAMAYADKEELRVLYLDKRNQLIADERQQVGTVDHTPVYPREVVKRALELSASALILVHNHPSGDPSPSRADVEMTQQIVEAARALGISLHDHIIVGRQGHASFKALGLI